MLVMTGGGMGGAKMPLAADDTTLCDTQGEPLRLLELGLYRVPPRRPARALLHIRDRTGRRFCRLKSRPGETRKLSVQHKLDPTVTLTSVLQKVSFGLLRWEDERE